MSGRKKGYLSSGFLGHPEERWQQIQSKLIRVSLSPHHDPTFFYQLPFAVYSSYKGREKVEFPSLKALKSK